MPKPFPKEFRRDVVAAARQGDQSRAQVALKVADRGLDGVGQPDASGGAQCHEPGLNLVSGDREQSVLLARDMP